MPSAVFISLSCLFLVWLVLELRKVARNVGLVRSSIQNDQLINIFLMASAATSLVDSFFLTRTLRPDNCL
jgi:hypothetical protein